MKPFHSLSTTMIGSLVLLAMLAGMPDDAAAKKPKRKPDSANWPSFRGTRAGGVADGFALPTTWNLEKSEGVQWKTPIPGLAHASVVIWEDRLFVTTVTSEKPEPKLKIGLYGASPDYPEAFEHQYEVYCLDKTTGKVLWSRVAAKALPKVKRHIKGTHGNCTPATDGQYVVAFFGSQGLYCYDMQGKLVWSKDFGLLDAGPPGYTDLQWGFASSPIIDEDRVYVQCDARNRAFVAALDLATGEEVWRTPRQEEGTWSTPSVHRSRKRDQLIVNGFKHIGGYDLRTGKELWRMSGGGDIPVPTPVVSGRLIYITNAHGAKAPIYAISTKAKGDITLADGKSKSRHISWSTEKGGAYMQTPLVYRGLLYNCRDNGVLTVYDAKTGKKRYRERLGGGSTGFTASPVAGDGKVYFTSEEGDVHVIKAGSQFELLATNSLGEICMSSAAISKGVLFFRARHHVIAIGSGDRPATP